MLLLTGVRGAQTILAVVPHHSAHLAKKVVHMTPAVAAAQNLLRKKLGMAREPQLSSEDFDRYLEQFEDGLTVKQVKAIGDLVMDFLTPEGAVGDEENVAQAC
jgi:predicted metal-dependent TIM-barrel fold hydrolase